MTHKKSLTGMIMAAALVGAAVVVLPSTVQAAEADCTIQGAALIEAHAQGKVFSDLAGPELAGKGRATIRNSTGCNVKETLTVFRSTNGRPPVNQVFFARTFITVPPFSTQTFSAATPNCMYQIDLNAGHVTTVDGMDQPLIAGYVVEGPFCDAPTPTPTPTPAPVVVAAAVATQVNSNVNVNNNSNTNTITVSPSIKQEAKQEVIREVVVKQAAVKAAPRIATAQKVVYVAAPAPVTAVPITAKTGPEDLALIATLSTGTGLLWTLRRLFA